MSRLRFPLKGSLRDPADEGAVSRMWQAIDSRFPRPHRKRSLAFIAVPVFAAAAGVALVAFLRHDAGPLRLATGAAVAAVDAPAGGARLAMSDGSAIELATGARFEPIESSASTFIGVLDHGTGTFDVRPGGPRRWQIECGLATVEVIGTRFSCARSAGRLLVNVEHGIVLVRGERVPSRTRRLAAGESLEVLEAQQAEGAQVAPASPASATGNDVAAAAPAEPVAPADRPGAVRAGNGSGWRELARSGHHREAFATLGAQGIRREVKRLGIADLFALADVARLSGHPADAVGPLQRIIDSFPSDPQAPLAAFALGRLELDDLGRPQAAVAAFSKALELGAPASLRDNVRARLEEARARMRNDAR
jgi:transmembrane sensor